MLAAAISPDGQQIASGGADQTVRVWDVVTGQSSRVATHTSAVKNVVFSDDGRRLTPSGTTRSKSPTWPETGALFGEVGPARTRKALPKRGPWTKWPTALSPNGTLAALGGGYTYKNGVLGFGGGLRTRPLRVVDVATGREVESFKLAGDSPARPT